MRIGIIGVPGAWSSERLAGSIERKTGFRLLADAGRLRFDGAERSVFHENVDLRTLDALIIKKIGPIYAPELVNRLELLKFCEDLGLPTFSRIEAIMRSFNRLSGTLHLQTHRIPMPETTVTENVEVALEAVERYGKAVFKPLYSTKARGMVVMRREETGLRGKIEEFVAQGNVAMYIQRMMRLPGRDLGVAFLGGRYLATYARVAAKDAWNTTINSGGQYTPHKPDDAIVLLADRAQKAFGLDFTGVDIIETEEGPMVLEVSAFGGFRGLLEGNGIDAAELYADHVIGKVRNGTAA